MRRIPGGLSLCLLIGLFVATVPSPAATLLPSTTSLVPSPNPAILGRPVTLTAFVTPGATGKVTFYDGATILGITSVANGATITTSSLSSGIHSLRARYGGDATYAGSVSTAVTQTVNAQTSNAFQPPVSYTSECLLTGGSSGGGGSNILLADVNGDGKPDLLSAASVFAGNSVTSSSLTVCLGNGDGTLQQAIHTTFTAIAINQLAVGDFNGDGKLDVAAGFYPQGGTPGLQILLGNGDGTFALSNAYPNAPGLGIVAGDFNGDGKTDLAFANGNNGLLYVQLGNGDGSFQTAATYSGEPANEFFYFLGIGDFNNDGALDLVSGQYLLLGNGDGTFKPPVQLTTAGPTVGIVGDFNGDGIPDIAFGGFGFVNLLLGKGDGTFQPGQGYNYPVQVSGGIAFTTTVQAFASGDFNGDGKLDLAVLTAGWNLQLLLGQGDGSFVLQTNVFQSQSPFINAIALAAGELNGDGKYDLVTTIQANSPNAAYAVLLGGAFQNLTASCPLGQTPVPTGAVYTINCTASGGDAPVTWSITAGALPQGLTLNASTGVITGTPTASGAYSFTVQAADSNTPAATAPVNLSFTVFTASSIQPSVIIDGPAPNSTLIGTVSLSGWAIDNISTAGPNAISSVTVFVDGAQVGTATYGGARPDVCAVYPGRQGCPNVGWTYSLDTSTVTSGSHTLKVVATDLAGNTGSKQINFTSNIQPSVLIDGPAANSTLSGSVKVSGWAIESIGGVGPYAVSAVTVWVDGTPVGTATYGGNRPDVCAVYPGRIGCANVGWSYTLNVSALSLGSHTLKVVATDTAGNSGFSQISFTAGLQPTVVIDTPAANALLGGTVNISGWAIESISGTGPNAVSSVGIFVDGTQVGTATYGSSRPDVCAVYPGRPGCPNVGWSYNLNTSALISGSQHTLKVVATDSAGNTGSSQINFTAGAQPSVVIDTPVANGVLSGTVAISGWAIESTGAAGPNAISSVAVLVDGSQVGIATYGSARPDVCAVYPGRPGCPNVGWSFNLNVSSLSVGNHALKIVATDSAGNTASSQIVFITGGPPTVIIDTPLNNTTLSGTVPVSGWAIESTTAAGPNAVSFVTVFVDGNQAGTATYGSSRPDVCAVYPGRLGCPNVGWSFSLNVSSLASGSHTLNIVATDTAGNTGSKQITFFK